MARKPGDCLPVALSHTTLGLIVLGQEEHCFGLRLCHVSGSKPEGAILTTRANPAQVGGNVVQADMTHKPGDCLPVALPNIILTLVFWQEKHCFGLWHHQALGFKAMRVKFQARFSPG